MDNILDELNQLDRLELDGDRTTDDEIEPEDLAFVVRGGR